MLRKSASIISRSREEETKKFFILGGGARCGSTTKGRRLPLHERKVGRGVLTSPPDVKNATNRSRRGEDTAPYHREQVQGANARRLVSANFLLMTKEWGEGRGEGSFQTASRTALLPTNRTLERRPPARLGLGSLAVLGRAGGRRSGSGAQNASAGRKILTSATALHELAAGFSCAACPPAGRAT